jgi:hypothetical protein
VRRLPPTVRVHVVHFSCSSVLFVDLCAFVGYLVTASGVRRDSSSSHRDVTPHSL